VLTNGFEWQIVALLGVEGKRIELDKECSFSYILLSRVDGVDGKWMKT
jgi:hypothetical protein